ncbi:MAG TPA: hypothetical protein VJL81_03150 [Solirubrobacterales bacterium]|nr:hypothetical protein [Solirubrobacterales bacterium]
MTHTKRWELPAIEAIAAQMAAVAAKHPDDDLAGLFRGTTDGYGAPRRG